MLNYILILVALSSMTNIIVWSKLFGYIKGYFGLGMIDDDPNSKILYFIKQIINCCDCLSIWIGIISIPFILYLNIIPTYIVLITPFLVNFCVSIFYNK